MWQSYLLEKLLPSSRWLKREFYNKFSFQNFIYSWPQSSAYRNTESSFFTPLRSRKSNYIPFRVDTIDRDCSFPKSASCVQRDFKRNSHPIRLLKQSLFTSDYFFITQSWFFFYTISYSQKRQHLPFKYPSSTLFRKIIGRIKI